MKVTGLKNKVTTILKLLFPKLWKKHYASKSMENTIMGGVFVEWWGYKINLGDYLTNVIVEYMLQAKNISLNKTRMGGGGRKSI